LRACARRPRTPPALRSRRAAPHLSRRRASAWLVLVAWVAVLGWHARREYFVPESVRLAAGARMLAPGAHFYLIRLQDDIIGMAQVRLDTVPGGFRFDDELTLDVPAL